LSTFWDELWIGALSPRPGVWPPDTFAPQEEEEDAPYLAAPDLDARLPSSLGERVQRPVGSLGLVLGTQHTIRLGEELARWVLGDQRDDLRAFQFLKARLASGAGTISESVYALVVEAVNALPDGLGVTAELFGDLDVA
jgi:hypothetical protein